MVESLVEKKKRMREVMKRMGKKYGPVKVAPNAFDVGQCIYLVLREHWNYRKATRAWKKLLEDFIDWNEIRVSYHREIRESIDFVGYADLDEKINRIREILKEVFHKYNRLHLEFLKEADFLKTRDFFANLAPLGKANAYIFLQCLMNEMETEDTKNTKRLVMSPEVMRVGICLGLIRKTRSQGVGRKEFDRLLDPSEYVSFQHLFVRHSELSCRSKTLVCDSCFLQEYVKLIDHELATSLRSESNN